uniref:Uncharacterized protein n=1 Tax=Oryza punctata TaxID=4537 RepID=A0A0E0KRC8_ORYPU
MAANWKLLFCFAILVATAILAVGSASRAGGTLAVPDLVVAAGEEEKYGCVYCTPGPGDRGFDDAETGTGTVYARPVGIRCC